MSYTARMDILTRKRWRLTVDGVEMGRFHTRRQANEAYDRVIFRSSEARLDEQVGGRWFSVCIYWPGPMPDTDTIRSQIFDHQ